LGGEGRNGMKLYKTERLRRITKLRRRGTRSDSTMKTKEKKYGNNVCIAEWKRKEDDEKCTRIKERQWERVSKMGEIFQI